jgi:hypothetical protein
MVCIMSNDDSAAAGVAARLTRRLTRSASALAVAAVQRWAWSTMVVPVAVAIVAAVAYLVYRRGRHARLGAALDSVLVTTEAVLDPEHPGTAAPRNPLRRGRHAIIQLLTRGAVARQRAAA